MLSDSDLEVAVKPLYVGMILSVSVYMKAAIATGSRKNVGSRIDTTSLCPPNHPDEVVSRSQNWNLHQVTIYAKVGRQSLAAGGCCETDTANAFVSFAAVGASASTFLDRVSAILTIDVTHAASPRTSLNELEVQY